MSLYHRSSGNTTLTRPLPSTFLGNVRTLIKGLHETIKIAREIEPVLKDTRFNQLTQIKDQLKITDKILDVTNPIIKHNFGIQTPIAQKYPEIPREVLVHDPNYRPRTEGEIRALELRKRALLTK